MQKQLTAAIVEDEKTARDFLAGLLLRYFPEIEISSVSENVATGIRNLTEHLPDIVFLDINLPDGTAFDILKNLNSKDFRLIFVTAYDDYALKAIKYSALDYIVKPIKINEFIEAVKKAKQEPSPAENSVGIQTLLSNQGTEDGKRKKIVLKTADFIHIVEVQDIVRCEAQSNYTCFYLKNKTKVLTSQTLKEYEDLLSGCCFFRVHKSHFVNLEHITKLDKREGGTLIMSDGSKVPVAARKRNQLLELFGSF